MVHEFILYEGVLNDNTLLIPSKGKVFKNQYIAKIKEYTFASEWHNKESIKNFRSKERLEKYLEKVYPDADLDFIGTCIE